MDKVIIVILLITITILIAKYMAMRKSFIVTHEVHSKIVNFLYDLANHYEINWDDSEKIDNVLDELAIKFNISRKD